MHIIIIIIMHIHYFWGGAVNSSQIILKFREGVPRFGCDCLVKEGAQFDWCEIPKHHHHSPAPTTTTIRPPTIPPPPHHPTPYRYTPYDFCTVCKQFKLIILILARGYNLFVRLIFSLNASCHTRIHISIRHYFPHFVSSRSDDLIRKEHGWTLQWPLQLTSTLHAERTH